MIIVKDLVKDFVGKVVAVNGINQHIKKDEKVVDKVPLYTYNNRARAKKACLG